MSNCKNCFSEAWNLILRNIMILLLIAIATLSLLDLTGFLWESKLFELNQSGLQDFLLLLAFESATYYAFVTFKMWQLNKNPVLRLQWNDLGRDSHFKQLKNEKVFLYDTYTDLQLVNDGNGSARDLLIEVEPLCRKEFPKIRNVTSIGPNSKTQLRYKGCGQGSNRNREYNNEDRSYAEPYSIMVSYKDLQGGSHKIKFVVDEDYNDGFKIIK